MNCSIGIRLPPTFKVKEETGHLASVTKTKEMCHDIKTVLENASGHPEIYKEKWIWYMQKVTKTRVGHPESYKVWSMELRETYKEKENGISRQLQRKRGRDKRKREQNIQPFFH
jgi:hypothetical protein